MASMLTTLIFKVTSQLTYVSCRCVKPRSMKLQRLNVQLHGANGFRGVLGAAGVAAALTQLQMSYCQMLDKDPTQGRENSITQLPVGLQHLSINYSGYHVSQQYFATGVLPALQQLTYLELRGVCVVGPDNARPPLQPLEDLTRLQDLRLDHLQTKIDNLYQISNFFKNMYEGVNITDSMLSGAHILTRLEVVQNTVDPECLAGRSRLRHLRLRSQSKLGDASFTLQLLSRLEDLQLTHLDVGFDYPSSSLLSMIGLSEDTRRAFSALTASSTLEYLNIEGWELPEGVSPHVFPADRRLPQLQYLDFGNVRQRLGSQDTALDTTRLVSCCPELRSLDMRQRNFGSELLTALPGLKRLHTLQLYCPVDGFTTAESLDLLSQLAALRELRVESREDLLFQLTQLMQLTWYQVDVRGPNQQCRHRPNQCFQRVWLP
jgi:hypothetical protein